MVDCCPSIHFICLNLNTSIPDQYAFVDRLQICHWWFALSPDVWGDGELSTYCNRLGRLSWSRIGYLAIWTRSWALEPCQASSLPAACWCQKTLWAVCWPFAAIANFQFCGGVQDIAGWIWKHWRDRRFTFWFCQWTADVCRWFVRSLALRDFCRHWTPVFGFTHDLCFFLDQPFDWS